jgi:hypothetical protein
MTTEISDKAARAALEIAFALSEAIRELGEVPSGHLYAHVMGKMDLELYEAAIGAIVRAGLVKRRGDVLVWVGTKENEVKAEPEELEEIEIQVDVNHGKCYCAQCGAPCDPGDSESGCCHATVLDDCS